MVSRRYLVSRRILIGRPVNQSVLGIIVARGYGEKPAVLGGILSKLHEFLIKILIFWIEISYLPSMSVLSKLRESLRRGQVYRRADFLPLSNNVDRHLKQLVEEGTLTKLAGGLYYYPTQTSFGAAPAEDKVLIKAFLKDHRFLLTSPNVYNTLGVGLTQLYNTTWVYNYKRHGHFRLGKLRYDFRMKRHFPKTLSEEFLLVDLVDNFHYLVDENYEATLESIKRRASRMNTKVLAKNIREYGGAKAKKFFQPLLAGAA